MAAGGGGDADAAKAGQHQRIDRELLRAVNARRAFDADQLVEGAEHFAPRHVKD